MSYQDRLRQLAINAAERLESEATDANPGLDASDSKTLALARLAALVAMSGSVPSYGEVTDTAVSAGASPEDCVAVLDSIVEIVGVPRIVEAAPKLALALGYDIEAALDDPLS